METATHEPSSALPERYEARSTALRNSRSVRFEAVWISKMGLISDGNLVASMTVVWPALFSLTELRTVARMISLGLPRAEMWDHEWMQSR